MQAGGQGFESPSLHFFSNGVMTSDNAKTVYVETSVVSYLTARATSNLLAAAWQAATAEWWDAHRPRFELRTSALTIEEAGRGHQEAAALRLGALDGIAMLPITEAAVTLAETLIRRRGTACKRPERCHFTSLCQLCMASIIC